MNNRTKNLKLDLQMFATASTQNQNATSASGMSAEMKNLLREAPDRPGRACPGA
mgnify:CR=1 FL=1